MTGVQTCALPIFTYAKRISFSGLVGIVGATDDDDAESSMKEVRKQYSKGTSINYKYDPKKDGYEIITNEQLEELEYELNEYPELAENILDKMKIPSLADMPKSKFMNSITRIREIKNNRNRTNQ